MTILNLVDPELRPGLELMPSSDLTDESLPRLRHGMAEILLSQPFPEGLRQPIEHMVPSATDEPDVRVLLFEPNPGRELRPAFLHIPGGGFVVGTSDVWAAQNASRAMEMGCVIVSVCYRLAPETRHPGPLNDCYAALKWLYAEAGALNINIRKIGVGGESAGGGLAAALALLARDRGEFPLAFQHLTYPMLDDRTCVAEEPHPYTGAYIWPRRNNDYGWRALLGHGPGSDGTDYYAAPARALDLTGLPPTFISVGALDLFLDEDVQYALRLTRAAVPVELHVFPGAYHAFDFYSQTASVSRESTRISRRAFEQFFRS